MSFFIIIVINNLLLILDSETRMAEELGIVHS